MNDLPAGWRRVTLAEIGVEAQTGFASGRHNSNGRGIAHLRPMNVTRDGQIDLSKVRFVEDGSGRRVHAGDVLFNNTNSPALVGKTALVTNDVPLAYSNHMTRLRVPDELRADFLAYQLHWLWMSGYFKTVLNNHVNQASVDRKRLLATPIVLPPLAEQQRIVATLEGYLAVLGQCMGNLRGVIEVENIGNTKRRVSLMANLSASIRNAYTWPAGDRLPNGWSWGTVGDVLEDIEAGQSFQCEARPAAMDEWGVIKVSAMTWGEFREDENKALPASRIPDQRYEIHPGDILVSRANTEEYVGAPVLVGNCRPHLLLSDKSLRLKSLPEVDRGWLVNVLASPRVRSEISSKATGTKDSMRNISQKSLRSIRIPIPSQREQEAIALKISSALTGANSLQQMAEDLLGRAKSLRGAIMISAFSGQM